MSTQDILNTILITGLLIILVCAVFITYFFIKALKSLIALADSLQSTTQTIREKIQMRVLTVLPALIVGLIGKILKRGR